MTVNKKTMQVTLGVVAALIAAYLISTVYRFQDVKVTTVDVAGKTKVEVKGTLVPKSTDEASAKPAIKFDLIPGSKKGTIEVNPIPESELFAPVPAATVEATVEATSTN